MTRFLYGAAVQGIQGFILQTNKLKEIAGASELVENICTRLFAEQLGKSWEALSSDPDAILNAAGNIKYIFTDEKVCRKVFLEFPQKVMEAAPGITISQAVVNFDGDFAKAVDALEKKLRIQRNLPAQPLTYGQMGVQRSRTTGLPAVTLEQGEFLDKASLNKREAAESHALFDKAVEPELGKLFRKPYDIEQMTGRNDWIAIIHADGNSLGQVVRQIGNQPEKFKKFSAKLDEATASAAKNAVSQVIRSSMGKVFPMRPVVLGGDDLTVIIRGDLALDFTKAYLVEFEAQTKKLLGGIDKSLSEGLTACAGIAYIKSSFPYYYGYSLAEDLCSAAKKDSKARDKVRSCLMFHKVQDSFVLSYEDIIRRELVADKDLTFQFGPYYLEGDTPEGKWSVEELESKVNSLDSDDGNVVKSGIRQWLSLVLDGHKNGAGKQKIDRMKSISGAGQKKLIDDLTADIYGGKSVSAVPAYDVLSLHSVTFQETK